MWNGYQPYQRKIRFFPHIIPIGFPLIFPIGVGLAIGLFHWLFPLLGILILVALAFFIVRTIALGSPGAAWNSMKGMGNQWSQRFNSPGQQPPYYQPSSPAGQQQPSQPYSQGYQPGSYPYYQPYQPYQPADHPNESAQPRAQSPEQMPPVQQQ